MKVGFIGTGNIGSPMAGHILRAGFDLFVHDVRRDAAESLVAEGATWAGSPREVAERCDIVCTCLPGPKEMEAVLLGEGGLIEAMGPGTVYIDHTTNSPELVRRVHGVLAKKGVGMVDAPVSGGMEGARTRALTVLVGGDVETLGRCTPVLDAMADTVMHVGPIGTGCVSKLMHNCVGFSLDLAILECLTAGVKAGVEPGVLVEVFQKCALGRGFGLKVRLPETIFQGAFEPRFALQIAHKDMMLATELGRAVDVPMRLAELSAQDMSDAMSRGWGRMDSTIFLTLQEERAGVEVRTNE